MKRVILNIASAPLPETVAAGDELEVQLAPYGDFPGVLGGRTVRQRCDRAAFERLAGNFSGEVLVDFEHKAERGGDTEAAAWVQALRVDPAKGLMATFRFTDKGAEAVANRRLRFLSPVWELDAEGRPGRLVSVGLTNKPNLPVRPILNRAATEQQPQGTPSMEEEKTPGAAPETRARLIELLALGPEADDDAIFHAVEGAVQAAAEAQEAALNAEAEAAAEENKDKIANKEAFKRLYVANRDAGRAFVATLRRVPAPTPVCNAAQARRPAPLAAEADADRDVLAKWERMAPGPEKDAFLVLNKAAIQRACSTPAD